MVLLSDFTLFCIFVLFTDAMRLQADLAEKLQKRRDQRLKSLEDKHMKEKANYLLKAEKSTNSADFSAVSNVLYLCSNSAGLSHLP